MGFVFEVVWVEKIRQVRTVDNILVWEVAGMMVQLAVGRIVGAGKIHLNMLLEQRTQLAAQEVQKQW